MKRNENIFISLEIQKDLDTKGLLLTVQFDRNAPNFHQENELINWCPTCDELDFITEAFQTIGGSTSHVPVKEETPQEEEPPLEVERTDYSHRSSEIRIAPLPNNMGLEEAEEVTEPQSRDREPDEKVFIQADEKKIDEILKRKKQMTREQNAQENEDKALIDRMIKQKKKR
ncbi:MAG TPA: hypothetical protein HA258_06805 [Thermoplasmata archaeon]|jgi:hypothetical protein|nr:hypothetical protein [Thermoplasmata archaeon]HIH28361.1 hypothetical protein [Thermoplasmata archaeon]